MITWDRIIEIHQKMSKDYPSGIRGLSAINTLKDFFEKNGCDSLTSAHPLYNKFFMGAEYNYQWFIQYVNKLTSANSISGFSEVAHRLLNPKTFLGANNEMEVALKFYLEGLNTSFIPINTSTPTPDILLKIENNEYNVEISSLNPSDQETLMYTFHSQLSQLTLGKGLVTGGFINKIPDPNVLASILFELKKKLMKFR